MIRAIRQRHALPACRTPLLLGALLMLSCCLILGACEQPGTTAPDPYGGSLNHVHDLLALQGMPHTLLLATHIGLYRSTDSGQHWSEVAGGDGQAIDGLMLFKLAQSLSNPQRVYVLAITRTAGKQKAAPGLYTSADAGKTWRLAVSESAMPTHNIYSVSTGASPGQVFALLPALREHGIYESDDAGAHWRPLPPLPVSDPLGITGTPLDPQRLILWSPSSGMFISENDGQTWQPPSGIEGGVFSVSEAGATIYAVGDSGLYVSQDAGAHFTLVNAADTFSRVVACAAQPTHAYALTGTTVYATIDGGHTWRPTGAMTNHPGSLAADPVNANAAYVGFSYPLGIAITSDSGAHWRQTLP